LVSELATLEPIPAETAATRLEQLAKAHPALTLPPRHDIEEVNPTGAAAVPGLCLTTRISEWGDAVDLALLDFDYQGVILDRHSPASRLRDDRVISVKRHREAEQAAVERLRQLGLREDDDWNETAGDDCFTHALDTGHDDPEPWLDFQVAAIPVLRAAGWRIRYHNFRYQLVEADDWICNVAQIERQEWFEISLGVEVEGEQIDLLPALLDLIRKLPPGIPDRKQVTTEHLIMPIGNPDAGERLLRLPVERVWPILELLYELLGNAAPDTGPGLRLNRVQLSWLSALGDDLHWLADEEMVQISRRLRALEGIPEAKPPKALRATLRPYQQQGLNWLQFLREYRLAGILADDMGLGKTLQALAHLLLEQEAGRADRPSLVVAPTSLLFNWQREAERFAPGLKVLVLHGPQRRQQFKKIQQHDLVITSYPLLTRDQATLRRQHFHLLILDEAQVIKNPATQAGRVLRELDARHRLCLTGTPMENHLGELWSLFDFLLPGLLGNEKQFRRLFRQPIEKCGDSAASQRLGDRVRPFLLRRVKQQVADELPEKTEIIHRVVLEGKQRDLYESVRLTMHHRVREEITRQGVAHSRILVLDALLKLRQVCCDPRLVNSDKARAIRHSAKLEALMELLPEMLEEGRRILIFSQFTGMLGLIEQAVRAAGHDYAKLTGQTRNREHQVRRFQEGEVPLFLISLKAGGVGLNLTSADTVIHYDPWWNPAVERQATDRAHRIGQQRAVFVYKLICAGTLEEKILSMQQRKQALADNLYRKGGNQEPTWNEADLNTLFAPLDEFQGPLP
jgi:superfamily II DNA or RNA helicase